jgi:hypothetical protein
MVRSSAVLDAILQDLEPGQPGLVIRVELGGG